MLRLLSVLMMVGALGMVLFSDRRPLRIRLGSAATFLALGVAALYGGRQGVITGMICFLLLYREGGGVIRTQRIVYYAFLGSIILGALVYARFNYLFTNGFSDLQPFRVLRVTSVGYCRIDDTAWVLQTIPDRIPYTGLLNALGSVFNFLPSARIPGTNTLYEHVVAHFYGGVNPAGGIGGANYSTAAELYAWGGWLSTIVFGYIIGLFFGILFEWQRRASSNPFLILLVVLISVRVFFFGVHARMPNIMYQAGVYVLVVAAMAALSVPSRRIMPFLLLLSWNLFPVMIWKLFDLDVLRVLVLATVPLLYFWGVQCLRIAGVYSRGRLFQNEDTQWVFGESISRRH
jgi:oligosaccharide repeat unit polymerase